MSQTNKSYFRLTGCIILTLWALLNALASLFVVIVPVVFFAGNAPALLAGLNEAQIKAIPPAVIENANSIAVFANGVNVAFCVLLLCAIWLGLWRGVRWVFWALSASLIAAFLAGVASDYVAGNDHPEVNLISGLILITGLLFSAKGLFNKQA